MFDFLPLILIVGILLAICILILVAGTFPLIGNKVTKILKPFITNEKKEDENNENKF